MKKLSKFQVFYLILTIFFSIVFVLKRILPTEILMVGTLGLFFGSIFYKKQKLVLIISLLLVLSISVLDPLLKSQLDFLLNVNTVETFGVSILINGFVWVIFFFGFYLGKKYH